MLSADLFREVRRIHIRTRRLVNDLFAGEYHSIFKGRGIDFTEVREYTPGDDVRTIDWNVTARLGEPYVKQYVEERELTAMLLVDVSASGRFGSVAKRKIDVATEMCAALALSAVSNNDKVGLILFSDRIEKFVPPQKGRTRVLRIIRELVDFRARGRGTDIARALEYLDRVSRRRTVSFLISDFLAGEFDRALRIAHRRHDVIPVSVTDRHEARLPPVGLVTLEDLETGELVLLDTGSSRARRAYEAAWSEACARRRQLFRSLGMDAIEVRTDEPWVQPFLRFFRSRERRLREGR